MRPILLWLLAIILLTENANAQRDTSANSMAPGCNGFLTRQEEIDRYDKGLCVGTILGLRFLSNSLLPQHSSCWPETATGEQAIRVALAYIEGRPERMHEDFRRLVIEAWHEAWPCK
jgi:hypothetical protein